MVIYMGYPLVGGFEPYPSEKMMESVSWDDEIAKIWKVIWKFYASKPPVAVIVADMFHQLQELPSGYD